MFRLARCQDLIDLRSRHPAGVLEWDDVALLRLKYPAFAWFEELRWGLKQAGTLVCVDHIERHGPRTAMEIGAGFNTAFDRRYGDRLELWTIDEAGFYPPDVLAAANAARPRTRFVDGLMGSRSAMLPDGYFDLVFSISVIEHIPDAEVPGAAAEMARVTRPGGWAVHSLDAPLAELPALAARWHAALTAAGFAIDGDPRVAPPRLDAAGPAQPLLEPISIVYQYYGGYRDDLWAKPRRTPHFHFGSLLIAARKPAPGESPPPPPQPAPTPTPTPNRRGLWRR